jgi:Fe-S cluster biogenesis protein NfuA
VGDTNEIKIMAEPQMNPDVCKFLVNQQVYDGMANCKNKDMAKGSPLLESLFAIDGVMEVMVAGFSITIAKTPEGSWADVGKDVGIVIREKLAEGGQLISEEQLNKEQPTNPELKKKIQKIFDEMVNPGLASHGGSVELIDVKGTSVFLAMSGGCQGCASSTYTLRYGIEQILKEHAPEVTDVVDVTDHSAGVSPYFS